MARKALAFPLVVLVATAATGWMYVLHPSLPGPRLGEALPLDELSRHAAVAIAWYAAVWAVAAVLLGLYARWAGIERLTAALALGLAVGSWSYFQLGVSVAVVRQVSLRSALDTAVHVHASYVAAAAVAIASAILARPKTGCIASSGSSRTSAPAPVGEAARASPRPIRCASMWPDRSGRAPPPRRWWVTGRSGPSHRMR